MSSYIHSVTTHLCRVIVAISLLTVLGASATTVRADFYNCCGTPIRRSSAVFSLNASTTSYPVGSIWRTRIQEAASGWSNLSETQLAISIGQDTNGVQIGNMESEIWFQSAAGPSNIDMGTFVDYTNIAGCAVEPCCNGCTPPNIIETDIVVYGTANGNTLPWKSGIPTGIDAFNGNQQFFYLVGMHHEIGHALGLTHSADGLARMSTNDPHGGWFHSGTTTVRPLPSDRIGAHALYPLNATYSDVYMINFQDAPSRGHTSWMLSYDPATNQDAFFPRSRTAIAGFGRNTARRGHTIDFRSCWGNLGPAAAAATTITVLLSTDVTPSAGDVNCGTVSVTFPAYSAGCQGINFVVPASTANGTYFILYQMGTGANDVAMVDRQLTIIN